MNKTAVAKELVLIAKELVATSPNYGMYEGQIEDCQSHSEGKSISRNIKEDKKLSSQERKQLLEKLKNSGFWS